MAIAKNRFLDKVLDRSNYRIGNINNLQISKETIAPQPNDYIVGKLEELITNLYKAIDSGEQVGTRANLINEISSSLTKRFGVPIKVLDSNNKELCTFPVMFKDHHTFLYEATVGELSDDIKSIYGSAKRGDKNIKDMTMINTSNLADTKALTNKLLENYKIAENLKAFENITIDVNKAYIKGIDKDVLAPMLIDFEWVHTECKITPIETVAVMMHEMGHIFTWIEYNRKMVKNTTVLLETLKEDIAKKGKTPKEAYENAYYKITKQKINTNNETEAGIELYKVTNPYMDSGTNKYSFTDSEQQADQFAGRFGLGKELATALPRLVKGYNKDFIRGVAIQCSLTIVAVLLAGLSALSIISAGISMFLIWSIYSNVFRTPTPINGEQTYDDMIQRMNRLKTEMIRTIRIYNKELCPDYVNYLIKNIEATDRIIKELPSPMVPLNHKLWSVLSSKFATGADMRLIEQLIEDTQENMLYVAAYKLKNVEV